MIELTVHADRVVLVAADQFAYRADELAYPGGDPADEVFVSDLLSRLTNVAVVVVHPPAESEPGRAAHKHLSAALRRAGVKVTGSGSYAGDVVGDVPQAAGRKLVRAAEPVLADPSAVEPAAAGAAEQIRAAELAAASIAANAAAAEPVKAAGKGTPGR